VKTKGWEWGEKRGRERKRERERFPVSHTENGSKDSRW
jgi:hypothetical protein